MGGEFGKGARNGFANPEELFLWFELILETLCFFGREHEGRPFDQALEV